jgi:uncharacterized protein YecA (UPF0149 family)
MFQLMNSLRDEAVVSRLLRMQLQVAETAAAAPTKSTAKKLAAGELDDLGEPEPPPQLPPVQVQQAPARSLPAKGAEARLYALENGLKRNDPCPCGSGQKFKKCCGVEEEASV